MDIRYLPRYKFVSQDKLYQKEACDVRAQYSTLFSLSSNQNYPAARFRRGFYRTDCLRARQTLSSNLSSLQRENLCHTQPCSTQNTRSGLWRYPGMDSKSLPQNNLSSLSAHPYRGFGTISSFCARDKPNGPLYLWSLSGHDCKRSSSACGLELENGQEFLERDFGQPNYDGLRILAVDEISIRKGHNYLTVVLDYISGRVLFIGKNRKAKTLMRFFNRLKPKQRKAIEAVSMDMWAPFIKAVRKKLTNAKIVFDLFHVVANFSRVIDKIRNSEYRKASKQDKAVYKGARFLLLKNRKNIRRQKERTQIKQLLELNQVINTVMILKDKLKHIWSYKSRTWAGKALDNWCALARSLKHRSLTAFAKMLERHRYGILSHCDYPIHNGTLEGVNNKIKVIKRKAYGFHDLRYFTLKIYQAFSN